MCVCMYLCSPNQSFYVPRMLAAFAGFIPNGVDNVKMRLDLPQKTKQNVVNSSRFKIIEALAKNYYVIVVKK